MTSRITDEQIIAYAAGDLAGDAADRIESHLAVSDEAADRVALYRLVAATAAEDDGVEPPAVAVARAKAIFRPRAMASRPGLLERIDEIVARLVFDSRLQPSAVRHEAVADRIRLHFETGDVEVDLQADRRGDAAPERWRLVGQVYAERGADDEVEVDLVPAGGDAPAVRVRTDGRGVFTLDIEPGTYELRVHAAGAVVVVPNIDIR